MDASNLNPLFNPANFVGQPVKKSVKWKAGEQELEADVYIKRINYATAAKDLTAKDVTDVLISRVANCVCDEKGNPIMTEADITGDADPSRGPMAQELFVALVTAVGEVNGSVKKAPRRRKKSSGTS